MFEEYDGLFAKQTEAKMQDSDGILSMNLISPWYINQLQMIARVTRRSNPVKIVTINWSAEM